MKAWNEQIVGQHFTILHTANKYCSMRIAEMLLNLPCALYNSFEMNYRYRMTDTFECNKQTLLVFHKWQQQSIENN